LLVLLALLSAVVGFQLATGLAVSSLLVVAAGVAAAWARHGLEVVSVRDVLTLPSYVLSKVPLYVSLARTGQRAWVRTARDTGSGGGTP